MTTPTTTKQFHILAVMSAVTGIMYKDKDKPTESGGNALCSVFFHLYDPYITPNGVALCQTHAHDEILRQRPELAVLLWRYGDPPVSEEEMLKRIHNYAGKNGSYVALEGPHHLTEYAVKLREAAGIPELPVPQGTP